MENIRASVHEGKNLFKCCISDNNEIKCFKCEKEDYSEMLTIQPAKVHDETVVCPDCGCRFSTSYEMNLHNKASFH